MVIYDVTALRCSEPLRSKVGGASKPSPGCAGWDRLDEGGDVWGWLSVRRFCGFLRHSQIFEQLFVLINTKEAFWNIQALQYQ